MRIGPFGAAFCRASLEIVAEDGMTGGLRIKRRKMVAQ